MHSVDYINIISHSQFSLKVFWLVKQNNNNNNNGKVWQDKLQYSAVAEVYFEFIAVDGEIITFGLLLPRDSVNNPPRAWHFAQYFFLLY